MSQLKTYTSKIYIMAKIAPSDKKIGHMLLLVANQVRQGFCFHFNLYIRPQGLPVDYSLLGYPILTQNPDNPVPFKRQRWHPNVTKACRAGMIRSLDPRIAHHQLRPRDMANDHAEFALSAMPRDDN